MSPVKIRWTPAALAALVALIAGCAPRYHRERKPIPVLTADAGTAIRETASVHLMIRGPEDQPVSINGLNLGGGYVLTSLHGLHRGSSQLKSDDTRTRHFEVCAFGEVSDVAFEVSEGMDARPGWGLLRLLDPLPGDGFPHDRLDFDTPVEVDETVYMYGRLVRGKLHSVADVARIQRLVLPGRVIDREPWREVVGNVDRFIAVDFGDDDTMGLSGSPVFRLDPESGEPICIGILEGSVTIVWNEGDEQTLVDNVQFILRPAELELPPDPRASTAGE